MNELNFSGILQQTLRLINDKTPFLSEPINEKCCVCNNELSSGGVKFSGIFSKSTFNLNQHFKNMQSNYICSYCAVFFKKQYWVDYCDRNGKDPYFPSVEGKKKSVANWMFFSHAFWKNTHKIVKNRSEWRDYLVNPPKPPFLFVISTLCKKHLILRSEMSYSSDNYPMQFEEKCVYVKIDRFSKCLSAFEKLYSMGLSKESIVSGNYNSAALLKCNKNEFIENENIVKEFRSKDVLYLPICEFVGVKNV